MARRLHALAVAVLLSLGSVIPNLARAEDEPEVRRPQVPALEVETYTLDNGLEVLLHQDPTTPVVCVNLWYKVGSMDEPPGRTGFAHLFEHLMFQGSKHHDDEYFLPLQKHGARINGTTNTDRTNYFQTVPSNVLELALWLEADRMGFLLPALTQEKLDNQRDVVKNERRQSFDNVPYGQAYEQILATLYPEDHPYHHTVIGSMADLSAASLEDVSNFFRTYYNPNNVSLCIAGDFDPAEAKRLVAKYFGPLPRGPEPERPEPWVPPLEGPRHVTMTDRVALPRAYLVWPTVPRGHDDEAALDVLTAILGQLDKENRLFRALMYDRQLAASVSAFHQASALSGMVAVTITGRSDQDLDELVALADAEIERLQNEGPRDDEVLKAQNTTESALIRSLQSVGRKADFLNEHNVYEGDPTAYLRQMERLFAVTAEDVQRVARTYLTPNRVRLDVNPGPPTPRAPEVPVDPDSQTELPEVELAAIHDAFDRSVMPEVGDVPDFSPPPVERRRLSNGLEVLVVPRHELPILTLSLVVKGGETLTPEGKEGLASLTASLLTEGTASLDALGLAGELSKIGASLDASGNLEESSVTLTTLTRHTDRALDLFADVLRRPAFPEKELERLRIERLANLMRLRDFPTAIAGIVFPRLLYGATHPYGRPELGTPETVRGITRDDVLALHQRLFTPSNAALIVVGDTTPEPIMAKLETELGDWEPGERAAPSLAEPPERAPNTVYLVDRPAAAQSVLAVGHVGVPRDSPDYFPLTVLNAVLGGQFASRINLNLREDKGYTYGARTHFDYRLGPGPFEVSTSVQTEVTREALVEILKELADIRGPRPASDDEVAFAKDLIIKGFPGRFETTGGVASALVELVLFDLPDDYFTHYQDHVEAVTPDDVHRVAETYLDPEHLVILIVGDGEQVAPQLRPLPFGKVIHLLDPDGNPLAADTEPPAEAGSAPEAD